MLSSYLRAFSAQVPNVFPGPAGLRIVEYFVRARDDRGAFLAGVGEEAHPLQMQIETIEAGSNTPIYKSPVLWVGVAVAVAAGVAAPFVLRTDAHPPPSTLGIERLK